MIHTIGVGFLLLRLKTTWIQLNLFSFSWSVSSAILHQYLIIKKLLPTFKCLLISDSITTQKRCKQYINQKHHVRFTCPSPCHYLLFTSKKAQPASTHYIYKEQQLRIYCFTTYGWYFFFIYLYYWRLSGSCSSNKPCFKAAFRVCACGGVCVSCQ